MSIDLMQRRSNRCGEFWSEGFAGDCYFIGDMEYVVTRDTNQVYGRPRYGSEFAPVENPIVLCELVRQATEDVEINRARDTYAAEVARGDGCLEEATRWHLEFTGGIHKEPLIREGVAFYQVGRNASHEFFIGTKDGKKYVYARGESGWDEEAGMPIMEESTREVEDWATCYLGHF